MIDGPALVSLVLDVGQHDVEHHWYAHPVLDEANRAGPSATTLAEIIDSSADIIGKRGWLIYRDEHPLLAVIGDDVHWNGTSLTLHRSPWRAVGEILFVLDAAKNAL